jgi:carbon-monoxide dehydrogenase small subunit
VTRYNINFTVNGTAYELQVEPYERLVDVLRDRLGLTGSKVGCGKGECGACTVIANGKAVLSCLMLAVQADGKHIETIEGLMKGAQLHPLQEAFIEHSAIQCGYCTSGMIMAAKALLDGKPDPTEEQVRTALSNNLCRCTGYEKPVEAVLDAARDMREKHGG